MPRFGRQETVVVEPRSVPEPPHVTPNADKTHKFLTTRRHPIYYMPITKCGSTFLKNLFYVLDRDAPHDSPDYIHDHPDDLLRADFAPGARLKASPYTFTVLRKPTSRFMSLYFDKIYGEGPQNFPEIREIIAQECGLDLSRGLDATAHRENCNRLIGWIGKNLSGDTELDVNPHWRPQHMRLGTVEHLSVELLTLDGLDWQLPHLLRDVVPDLDAKLAMARSRNATAYPVAPADILDDDLEWKINDLYADDYVLYQHIHRRWSVLKDQQLPAPDDAPRLNVLTTHTQNFNIVTMQKAGCTYLRNLTYRLDHGRAHPEPGAIAADGCLAHASKTEDALSSGVSVIVLRDPYARFFSLYFDKVWGESQQAFPWIAKQLSKNRRFRASRELSEAEHHDNCCRFIGYLEKRFKERPVEDLNPHWQPQIVKAKRAARFGLIPVMLEDFDAQITQISEGRIKGLEEALAEGAHRNATEKPIAPEALLSPWIKERLQALYAEDIALVDRVRAGWATGTVPHL